MASDRITLQTQAGVTEKVVVVSGFRLLAVPGALGVGNGTSLHLPWLIPRQTQLFHLCSRSRRAHHTSHLI